jgi:hypothetical protein
VVLTVLVLVSMTETDRRLRPYGINPWDAT